MAILISSRRTILVDSCGVARIVAGDSCNIFPTIQSTIDGWRLDGINDDEWLAGEWLAEDDNDNDIAEDVQREETIQGLVNATRKERERNRGYTDEQESERLANLAAMVERGFAFERPAMSDKFDDYDTETHCEENYRYNDNGDEV